MKIVINSKDHKEMSSVIEALIRKKHAEYPSINRFIVDFEFANTKDGKRLDVMSTFLPNNN